MKKTSFSIFLVFICLVIFQSACAPKATPLAPWSLVAVGDSIGANSPSDCPGCTGFVDRYASAITATTGHPVETQNFSKVGGVRIDDLLDDLATYASRRDALADADIIIVGISNNDTPWNRDDDPCDGPYTETIDWSKYNATCAAEAAEIFRPKFESVYSQVAALRAGKPTLLLTINAYNFWNSQESFEVALEDLPAVGQVLDAWNAMICQAAEQNGFLCADIYHAFNGPDGLTASPELIAKGSVHPSDKGNQVIAEVLFDLGLGPLVP